MEDKEEITALPGASCGYVEYAGVVEGIVMLFSACIIGYSSYYFVALGPIMSSLTFGAATVASLVASVLLFIFGACTEGSIVGQSYRLEGVLEFTVLSMIVVVLASGISLLVYRENFENVKNNNLHNDLDNTVLTYSLAVFHECCSLENELPKACGLTPVYPCYEDESKFNEFMGKAPCGLLRVKEQVSAVDSESCANQELIPFVASFMDFLYDETTKFGATVTGLGAVMVVLSIGVSLCMYFGATEEVDVDYNNKTYPAQKAVNFGKVFQATDVMQAAKDNDIERRQRKQESKRLKKERREAKKDRKLFKQYEDDYNENPHDLPLLSEEMEAKDPKNKATEEEEEEGGERAIKEIILD